MSIPARHSGLRSGEGGAISDNRLVNRQLIADGFRMRADSVEACRFILAGAVPISVLDALVFRELPQDLVARCIVQQFFCSSPLSILASFRLKARRPCCDLGGGAVGFSSGLVGSVG